MTTALRVVLRGLAVVLPVVWRRVPAEAMFPLSARSRRAEPRRDHRVRSIAFEGTFLGRSLRHALDLVSKSTFGPITLERELAERPRKKPEQAVAPF